MARLELLGLLRRNLQVQLEAEIVALSGINYCIDMYHHFADRNLVEGFCERLLYMHFWIHNVS